MLKALLSLLIELSMLAARSYLQVYASSAQLLVIRCHLIDAVKHSFCSPTYLHTDFKHLHVCPADFQPSPIPRMGPAAVEGLGLQEKATISRPKAYLTAALI